MPSLDVQHVVDDLVEKGAVVADDDAPSRRGREVALLQPVGGLEVEVVRRFVEQEEVGRRGELARPGPRVRARRRSATGERPGLATPRRRSRVPAAPRPRGRERCSRPRARTAPGRARSARAADGSGCRPCSASFVVMLGERALERHHRMERVRRRVPDRRRVAEVAMLVEQRHAEARRARDRPARRHPVAGHDVDQRRLAAAVPADDAPPVSTRPR